MKRTQAELAQLLGVSRVTVNKALRGHPSVQAETRDRILQLASELGYRPSAAARAMRSGQTGFISMLLAMGADRAYLPYSLLHGVQETLAAKDMQLTLAELPDEMLTSEGYLPKILRELSSDGLLLNYIFHVPEHMIELIKRFGVPSIFINNKLDADCVYPDDFEGARWATRDLIALGHRKIGYLCYHLSPHYSITDRRLGYEKAMIDAGLTPQIFMPPERRSVEETHREVRVWLQRDDRPTACLSYEMRDANALYLEASALGFRVPQQLSIVALSDSTPDVTGMLLKTLRIPFRAVGKVAVEMILQKIAAPHDVLPPRVVPFSEYYDGVSCAPL